jgi:DNA polymerase III delta prime subunit
MDNATATPCGGLLVYGPPGVGKTPLTKNLLPELGGFVAAVTSSEESGAQDLSVIGPKSPLPTADEHWCAIFKNRIIQRLTREGYGWDLVSAQNLADQELAAMDQLYTDNPTAAADEALSYWESDGE